MTLQNLYFFTEIVKDMNLGLTATRLYTSQQALSGHIKRLESHFGVRLFERRPNLALTPEGELLMREAKVILDAESRLFIAYETGVQKDHGALRIACGLGRSKFYLPDALIRFSEIYPGVGVSCVDENRFRDTPMFGEGGVDLSVGRVIDDEPGIRRMTLFTMHSSFVIARSLLESALGDQTDAFIADAAENGLDLKKLPKSVPIIHTGMPGQEHWLCAQLPILRTFPRVQITHGNHDVQFQICASGRGAMIVSSLYIRCVKQTLSPAYLNDLLFFDHVTDGKPIETDEVLSYDPTVAHPQFFFDFIRVLRTELAEKGLVQLPETEKTTTSML